MNKDNSIYGKKKQRISTILPTDDQLTGRVGLSFFAIYPENRIKRTL
jgi:hypothetical protein